MPVRNKPEPFKPLVPSEDSECIAFVQYLRLKGIKHFCHIANEMPAVKMRGFKPDGRPNWTKNYKTLSRNKNMGVTRGVPDYMILIERDGTKMAGQRNNILLFVEMKRLSGGSLSPEQRDWINGLNKVFGAVAVVAKGFDQAKKIIDAYVN